MSAGNGNSNGDGGFTFPKGPTMPKIATGAKRGSGICHDDSVPTVKATTIDELHSLQKKRSAPTTPINQSGAAAFAAVSEEERQKIQLQSISASLASLTRESGPKVVRGDPAEKKTDGSTTPAYAHGQHHSIFSPALGAVSDSSLKVTHVLYNLSPAFIYKKREEENMGSSCLCILPCFRSRQIVGGGDDGYGYGYGSYDGDGNGDSYIPAEQYEVIPCLTGEPSIVKIFPPQKSIPKSHNNRQILPAE